MKLLPTDKIGAYVFGILLVMFVSAILFSGGCAMFDPCAYIPTDYSNGESKCL